MLQMLNNKATIGFGFVFGLNLILEDFGLCEYWKVTHTFITIISGLITLAMIGFCMLEYLSKHIDKVEREMENDKVEREMEKARDEYLKKARELEYKYASSVNSLMSLVTQLESELSEFEDVKNEEE